MKLIHSNSPLIHSDDMQSSIMGMDSTGMEMATFYLRDKIYSNKIGAVVREYICNALDEHKKHNINSAVKIKLEKDNIYSVRDFAKGLNEHDVRNIFGMYFRSTKSSDNSQTGGFGLGSKAGFCYTDTFYVKSFHQGTATTYACSLGAGQNGVSVGQILKVLEEPTQESGLEVSLEIKDKDVWEFCSQTKHFLSTCLQSAEFYEKGNQHTNVEPVKTFKIDDFEFKLIKNPINSHLNNIVFFCMGNVSYKSYIFSNDFNKKFKNEIVQNHYIIIDIPIGKMSLPISRESFESTPNNQKVLEKINNSFEELQTMDAQSIKTLSIQELINTRDEFFQNGEFFCFKKSSLYPEEIYKVVSNIKSYADKQTLPLEKKDEKYIVAVIPNKDSENYWIEKFRSHLQSINKNYYYINERYLNDQTFKNFENLFLFKKVKSSIFAWPKKQLVAKDGLDAKYVVTHNFGGSWKSQKEEMNALQLHNMVFKNNAVDEQSARNDFVNLKLDTFISLNNVSIKKSFGPGEHVFSTTSQKMLENMKLLGWYEIGSSEYVAKKEEIREFINKENEKNSKLNQCKLTFLHNCDLIVNKLNKKQKYVYKYHCILQKIKNEKSLRSNLLNSLEYSSWSLSRINRKQLRTILKIKD